MGAETAVGDPRLPFVFSTPSRLIRIIGFQSSSGPSPRPLPSGPHFLPPFQPPSRWLAGQCVGRDSELRLVERTPDVAPPAVLGFSPNRPPEKSFQCARPRCWRGRSQTSSEFRGR